MQTRLDPYASFKDNARKAMEFYSSIFGGKLDMKTFKQYSISSDPTEDDKIMHASLAGSMCYFYENEWLRTRRSNECEQ
jgi:PhnB protein